jgi:hypothetical protein
MMKKGFIFVLLLLILPIISAVQINMKSNYSMGETLIAQVSGNFLTQIQQQNVLLYSGHVRVSFIPTVQKIGDTFYLYGQLYGKSSGNYSLVISGVTYSENLVSNSNDIVQNFTITNNSADFFVSPGFIESNNTFSISAQNLGDNSISVNSFFENSTTNTNTNSDFFASLFGTGSNPQITPTTATQIGPQQIGQIPFSVSSTNQNQLLVAVLQTNNTDYEIPVIVPSNQTQVAILYSSLIFQPQQEVFSMSTNSNFSSYLSLYNSGPSQNVTLSISNNLQPYVSIPNITILGNNSTFLIPINITSNSTENIIGGQITAASPSSTAYFSLILNISNGYIAPANGTTLFQTCSQLNGTFCNDTTACTVPTQAAENGACCIGTCQPISSNSSGLVIGWILAAIMILFLVFFFVRRYKKAKRKVNLLEPKKK